MKICNENLPAIARNCIKILMSMMSDSFRVLKSSQSSLKKSQQLRSSNKKSIYGIQEESRSKAKRHSKVSVEKYKDSLEEDKEKYKNDEHKESRSSGAKTTDVPVSKSPLKRHNDSEAILRRPRNTLHNNKGGYEDMKEGLELPENYSVIQVYNNYTRKSGDYFDPYLQYGGESM
jgi:hypothetical protein